MACVTCHVSHVTCHVSHVMCHMSQLFNLIFFFFFLGQSGEAYQWRVCYQRGLPRLVLSDKIGKNLINLRNIPYKKNVLRLQIFHCECYVSI